MSIITKITSSPRTLGLLDKFSRGNPSRSKIAIHNVSILAGQELEYIKRGRIEIQGALITSVEYIADQVHSPTKRIALKKDTTINSNLDSRVESYDGSGLLIIPAFVNAHTHLGDSIGKDIAVSAGLDVRVNPVFGIKRKILQSTPRDQLRSFMRFAAISMLRKGITTFADFREGGSDGILLLRSALDGLPIRCIALGRAEYYSASQTNALYSKMHGSSYDSVVAMNPYGLQPNSNKKMEKEIDQVLEVSDGLGISGANEHTDDMLAMYRKIADKCAAGNRTRVVRVAIHAAESPEAVEVSKSNTGKSEVERIHETLKPNILIHMTNASESEIADAAQRGIGIVICPRANAVLGTGFPPVSSMLDRGCTVALGTDNVMINSPDMFREMDYVWKASRAIERGRKMLEARDVIKMATVNAAKIFELNSGCIEPGRFADLIFIDTNHIDISPMHDPYATIVQRATSDCIKAVMTGGQLVELTSDGM